MTVVKNVILTCSLINLVVIATDILLLRPFLMSKPKIDRIL